MALNRVLSVSQLNDYIAGTMAHDPILRNLSLRGEISNMRVTSAGHAYFALKDEDAAISCVCFASALEALAFAPKDGDHVTARGYVSVYAKSGQMQFYAQDMEQEGLGRLYVRFEALKQSLAEKGYFAQERKRPVPAYPRCIGIVTSPTGAVLQDIRNVAWRRNPGQKLLLCPARVQGDGAAAEIVRGIELLNTIEEVDVIILARGGGSLEDLWAFNELAVAEAVFASQKPIVSAVGHETDFSIADFVADLRAPTPSAAAELTTPQIESSRVEWERFRRRLADAMKKQLEQRKMTLRFLAHREGMGKTRRRIDEAWVALDYIEDRLVGHVKTGAEKRGTRLSELALRLELAGPDSLLQRGYALVQKADGGIVTDAESLANGESIGIRFAKGNVRAEVREVDSGFVKE